MVMHFDLRVERDNAPVFEIRDQPIPSFDHLQNPVMAREYVIYNMLARFLSLNLFMVDRDLVSDINQRKLTVTEYMLQQHRDTFNGCGWRLYIRPVRFTLEQRRANFLQGYNV